MSEELMRRLPATLTSTVALAIALIHVDVAAAQSRPDFSGRWVMVSPEPGNTLIISQDATTLTMGSPNQHGASQVFNLDGSESRNVAPADGGGNIVTISRSSWKGDQLILTNVLTWPTGQKLDQVLRFSIDNASQLVMEVELRGDIATKM